MSKVTVFTIILMLLTVSSYGLYFMRNSPSNASEDIESFFDENDDTEAKNNTETDDEEFESIIKIGFINPITGPIAQESAGFTFGAEVAIDDLNEAYAESGLNLLFELVEVDSGCDGEAATEAAQTLADLRVIAVGGAACSGASMAANAVLSAAGIPMISYASTNHGLSDASEYPDFFRIVPSNAVGGQAAAELMDGKGVTNPAILQMFDDYDGVVLADSFEEEWGADNICQKIINAIDISAEVTKIADAGCDAIFIVSNEAGSAEILNEVAVQELDVMLVAIDDYSGIEELLGEFKDNIDADELYFLKPHTSSSYGDFEEYYNDSGVESIRQLVLTSYDVIKIIGHAAFKLYNDECLSITDCIFAVGNNYEGASGLHTFLENGDVAGPGYEICYFTGDLIDASYGCYQYWTLEDGIHSLNYHDECNTSATFNSSITEQNMSLRDDLLDLGINSSIIPTMTDGDYLYILYLNGGGGDSSKSELRLCFTHTPFQSIVSGSSDSEEIWRTKIGIDELSMFEFNDVGWVEESQSKAATSVYVTLDSKWGTNKDTSIHWLMFFDRPIEFSYYHPGTDNFGEFRVEEYVVSD